MALIRVAAAAPVAISQSTMIVGALLVFFILWLAANGKLLTYWQFLTGGGKSAAPATASGTNPGGGTGFSPTVPFSSTWWDNFLRPWMPSGRGAQ